MHDLKGHKRPESVAIVRAEMERRDITYEMLHELLKEAGKDIGTSAALRRRIARGMFTFTFFLDVMRAMSIDEIKWGPKPVSFTGKWSKK